ncbi:MAG: RNA methyltransferase [Oscillospiraceae bacterium]|nr:RNA methyltransferase [Oscillospiraceae bacterium]
MQKITEITSRENPAVRHYIRLRDKKKARREEKLFVLEGLRIVLDALQYPYLVQQVFMTESVSQADADKIPEKMQETGQIFKIPDAIGKSMSDTEHTQGVFAVCRMPEQKISLAPDGKYLVLCQLQDPGNMGMILRTCDALGTDAVLLSQCCDLYSPKVIRATMGSVFRVPVLEIPEPAVLLDLLHENQICSYAAVPAEHAVSLTDCRFSGGCAVWIGNEGNGLPDSVISACDKAVTIPMSGGAESLNAAMAAGILTWEMMKSDQK